MEEKMKSVNDNGVTMNQYELHQEPLYFFRKFLMFSLKSSVSISPLMTR